MSPSELISLTKMLYSLQESAEKKNDNYNSKNSNLHLHLLNRWDIKKILKFMKAFLAKGRSLFEESFPFNPKVDNESWQYHQEHIKALIRELVLL
jgi:DNA-binding GntR family transcriptional regulator